MQKLDFVQHLKVVVDKLESEKIIILFNRQINNVGNKEKATYNFSKVTALLFTSKVNFENLKQQEDYALFLQEIGAYEIYDEDNLAHLSQFLTTSSSIEIFKNPAILELYSFHNHLIKMLQATKTLLLNELTEKDFGASLDEGVLVFQIVLGDEEYISSDEYIHILSTLQKLVNTIGKALIDKNEDYQTSIVLLDSGSDTNIGIQTFAEVAKAIFGIFKEIWTYITNHGIYQNEKKNKTLIESLAIRKEIQEKVKEGILTEQEAKEYIHLVKTRVDRLIGMKVLPKEILISSQTQAQTGRNLLEELQIKGFLAEEADKTDEG